MKQGRLNRDLISAADFLPTICEAAGAPVPKNLDGASFLPQLRGEKGTPREWLYIWYSPRQREDMTVQECAFNHDYKLYRTGQFYDLTSDPFEEKPLETATLTGRAAEASKQLQTVLDRLKNARPAELDRQFKELSESPLAAAKKKRAKR